MFAFFCVSGGPLEDIPVPDIAGSNCDVPGGNIQVTFYVVIAILNHTAASSCSGKDYCFFSHGLFNITIKCVIWFSINITVVNHRTLNNDYNDNEKALIRM